MLFKFDFATRWNRSKRFIFNAEDADEEEDLEEDGDGEIFDPGM